MGNKKWAWVVALLVGLLNGIYTAFVAMCFWNWFAVRVLNINIISFPEMLGIVWLISLFTDQTNKDESKWKILFSVVDACVPDHNREMLAETMAGHKENIWMDAFTAAFVRIAGTTVTLVLGYGLHVLF